MAILRASSRIVVFGRSRSPGLLMRGGGAASSICGVSAVALGLATFTPLLGLVPAMAQTLGNGQGIFVNDGSDANCAESTDSGTAWIVLSGKGAQCTPVDKSTETSRVLFYNPSAQSGSTSLALGNELYVNGGKIGVSDQVGGTYSMRMGSAATLASAVGANAIAIGSAQTSATDGATSVATQALGGNSIAIGSRTVATGAGDIAIGQQASATGGVSGTTALSAFAIGIQAKASGSDTQAIGNNAQAVADYTNAIGNFSVASQRNATAIGNSANAGGVAATAIGNFASAGGQNSTAIGAGGVAGTFVGAQAGGVGAVAIGGNAASAASAQASDAIAIGGQSSVATANTSGIAIGRGATVNGAYGIATGDGAVTGATGQNVAIGTAGTTANAATAAGGAVAIGRGQKATGNGAVAIGDPNVANGTGAVSTGANNVAAGDAAGATAANGAVAIGNSNQAIGQGSVALGNSSTALVAGGIALGDAANAKASKSVALGSNAVANNASDVALGAGSTTAAPHTGAYVLAGSTTPAAGTAGTSVVSVGVPGAERQIQNVGAGVLSATSTDAVNGSQLFATNQALATTTAKLTHYYSVNDNGAQGGNYNNNGATGVNSLAAGVGAIAQGGGTVAMGNNASAAKDGDLAIGLGAAANSGTGTSALAIGTSAKASSTTAVAIGYNSQALSTQALAFGSFSTASGLLSTAIGNVSEADGDYSTAIGPGASAWATNAIGIGPNAVAATDNSIVIGQSTAYGASAVSVGTNNVLLGDNSGAFGNHDNIGDSNTGAGGTGSFAVGNGNTITANSAFVLGNGVTIGAGLDGAVALGDGATVTTSSPTPTGTINGKTYTYAGGAPATGNVVSVGAAGAERQIQNVAAGRVTQTSTDAVNGSQLFATNSAINDVAATANKGWNVKAAATGTGTVTGATTANVAPGATQTITAGNNIAIAQNGTDLTIATSATPTFATVNSGSVTTTNLTVNSGGTVNMGGNAITNVAAGVNNSDAVNVNQLNTALTSVQTHYYSVNDGGSPQPNYNNNGATGLNSLAAGVNASANGQSSIAMGDGANAALSHGIAIGPFATSSGPGGIAIGEYSVADGESDVYIGGAAGSNGDVSNFRNAGLGERAGSFVLGSDNTAVGGTSGNNVTGVANFAGGAYAGSNVAGNFNVAIGGVGSTCGGSGGNNLMDCNAASDAAGINVTGDRNIAIGNAAGVGIGASDTVAFGTQSLASRNAAIAIGTNASSAMVSAVAIGQNATAATNVGDVALGSGSTTGQAAPTASSTINGVTYAYAGTNPTSAVSVGTAGNERQIQNVAAGRVTAASTDAINGSQLFATNSAIEAAKATANAGWNVTTSAVGSGTVSGTTTANVAPGATQMVTAGNNIAITQNGTDLTIATNPALAVDSMTINNGGPAITRTGIDMKNTKIVNVAAGTDPGDVVNYSQLTNVSNTLTAAGLNFVDAAGNMIHRDLGGTLPVIGSTTAAASALDSTGKATAGTYSAANVQTYADAASGQLQVQLADSPEFTSMKTGNTTISNNGLTIAGGPSVTSTGIDAGGSKIVNVAAGSDPNDAVNYSQLTQVSNAANAGWNVTTTAIGTGTVSGTTTAKVAPGATQTVTAGNNIAIGQNGIDLTIATNPDMVSDSLTTGNTRVDTNGIAVTGGTNRTVTLTGAGLDNGGNRIVNIAAGTVSAASTDAINGSQLYSAGSSTAAALGGTSAYNSTTNRVTAGLSVGGNSYTNVQDALTAVNTTASAGWNVTSGSVGTGTVVKTGAPGNVAPGGSAKFTAGNNVALTQNGTEIQVALSNNITVDSVTVNGGPTMDSNGIAMAGDRITGLAAGTISAASTDGVNGSQLFAAGTSIASALGGGSTFNPITGAVTASLNVGGNNYNNVQDALNSVAAAAAGAGWKVATRAIGSGTATNLGGNANVAPGGTATFTAGNNIAVTQNGTEVQVALKNDVTLNSVTANSVAINGGPTISNQGIVMGPNETLDMGGGKITNVAAGTAATDAVNLGQLNQGMASTLSSANAYTDSRVNALSYDIGRADRNARGGTAAAMAMSQVPQAFEPGMGIIGMGASTFMGEQSIAVGYSKASDNGRVVVKAAGSYNSRGQGGVAAGVGFQF